MNNFTWIFQVPLCLAVFLGLCKGKTLLWRGCQGNNANIRRCPNLRSLFFNFKIIFPKRELREMPTKERCRMWKHFHEKSPTCQPMKRSKWQILQKRIKNFPGRCENGIFGNTFKVENKEYTWRVPNNIPKKLLRQFWCFHLLKLIKKNGMLHLTNYNTSGPGSDAHFKLSTLKRQKNQFWTATTTN